MNLSITITLLVVSLAACVLSAATPPVAVPATAGRDLLFTDDWKFFKGDDAGAKEPVFDDTAWRMLDLPHDWSVEGPFDSKLASCTAFLPCGIAWYRKSFTIPADAAEKSVFIRFDGISNHSTIWCNGKQVGERPYGYSSFTCELTSAIQFGGENVIAVRVDHEQYADSRWYVGSGIYRNVFLSVADKVHVGTNGMFVTTPKVTADSADLSVQTDVRNDGTVAADVTIVTTIRDGNGRPVASIQQTGSVPAGGQKAFSTTGKVAQPALWSPDHPSLYTAETELKRNDIVIDEYSTTFGIRSYVFDPASGFSINGQSLKIKGVCVHHDAGALGAAVPIAVWERRLKLLQEAGCNAIRCSHNPPAPEFLDLCDRMGFLVMDEAFDEWTQGKKKWVVGHDVGPPGTDGYHSDFDKWSDTDIRDMVLRDRNHPSIIMWSIGNEIDYNNDPFPPNSPLLPPIAERLIKDVKALDNTRPVTAACAFPATNLFKKLLDIEGFNYMERLYASDHAANPMRIMFGSENSQSLMAWQAVAQNPYIAGQFLWTGIDYLGEAGVWPSHGSGAGLLNLAGFPKTQYYFRQSLWSDTPMVYLTTRGLPRRGRATTAPAGYPLLCFTNCDSVELFQDGKSLGTKPHAVGETLVWPTDSTNGVYKAIGKKGSATTTFELKRAGPASKLVARCDVSSLKPDGHSVAQIEVDVTDADGTLVPDAANLVTCDVSGPGRIIGIENGDLRDSQNYKELSRKVYQGRMLVYLQSLRSAGEVKLTISSPDLEEASTVFAAH